MLVVVFGFQYDCFRPVYFFYSLRDAPFVTHVGPWYEILWAALLFTLRGAPQKILSGMVDFGGFIGFG